MKTINQLKQFREDFQYYEEKKEKSTSRKKRDAIKGIQKIICLKFNEVRK